MILGKIWRAIKAQCNKLANYFRRIDPIAQMQYECDLATESMKQGRLGLEQHRGLIERVRRQTEDGQHHVWELEGKISTYLQAGDRDSAGKLALELGRAEEQLRENQGQLKLLEEAYENNLLKVKHASQKIQEVKNRIAQYDADLKLSRTEAEIARLAQSLNFEVTTDFGQVEQLVQEKIDANRAVVRVATDLSGQGLDQIRHEENLEKLRAEEALKRFEHRLPAPQENNHPGVETRA